ncbi:MAG: hypothetical protein ACR2OR_05000 [Hyphomicrobiales bacterium]
MTRFCYGIYIAWLAFSFSIGSAVAQDQKPRTVLSALGQWFSKLVDSEPEGVGKNQAGDGALLNPDATAKAMAKRFKLLRGSDFIPESNFPVGYLRVYFNAVDWRGNNYGLKDPDTKSIFDRTILDWAKSLLATRNRDYLVTLDILDNSARVIASQPIFHFKYESGFSYKSEFMSQNINGYIGYPVLSDEPVKVRLSVRYLDDLNASQTVDALVAAASAALTGGVVPTNVASIFKAVQVPAINTKLADLQTKFGQFKEIEKVSRTAELSYKKEDDKYIGFVYHFLAPNLGDQDVLKLKVKLEYSNSLLTSGSGGSIDTDLVNVAGKRIQEKEASFPMLVPFVKANAVFQERWQGISKAKMASICDAIRGSFRGKLTAMYASLGLEAFLDSQRGTIAPHWDPNCYRQDDLDALKLLRPGKKTTFEAPNFNGDTATRVSFAQQIKGFLDAARVLLLSTHADLQSPVAADAIATRQGQITAKLNGGNIQMTGMPEFFGNAYPNEAYNSGWLVHALFSTRTGTTGCYWRDAHSTAEEPNIGTMLSEHSGKIYAHKIIFEKSKKEGVSIRPLKWEIFQAPSALLKKYSDKFTQGCPTTKWKPWAGV